MVFREEHVLVDFFSDSVKYIKLEYLVVFASS